MLVGLAWWAVEDEPGLLDFGGSVNELKALFSRTEEGKFMAFAFGCWGALLSDTWLGYLLRVYKFHDKIDICKMIFTKFKVQEETEGKRKQTPQSKGNLKLRHFWML